MTSTLTAAIYAILATLCVRMALKRFSDGHITSLFYLHCLVFFCAAGFMRSIFPTPYYYPLGFRLEIPNIASFSPQVQLRASVVTALVVIGFAVGESLILGRRIRPGTSQAVRPFKPHFVMMVSLVLAIIGVFVFIWSRGLPLSLSVLLSSAARTEYRLAESWAGALVAGQLVCLVAISNYLALLHRRYGILFVGALVTYLMMSFTGTRSYALLTIGPICGWYLSLVRRRKIRVQFARIAWVSLLVVAIAPASELIRMWRWENERTVSRLASMAIDSSTYRMLFEYPLSEMNVYSYFLNWVSYLYPQHNDFIDGHTYVNIGLFWLPSGVTNGLKVDTIHVFSDAVTARRGSFETKSSMHPTFPGDCYMNFGWLCSLPAAAWGALFGSLHRRAAEDRTANLFQNALGVFVLVYLLRGSLYNACFTAICCGFYCHVWTVGLTVDHASRQTLLSIKRARAAHSSRSLAFNSGKK